jgi:hypothetical protein
VGRIGRVKKTAEGANIYSGSRELDGLPASLTNPTELSYKKGTIRKHYPVEFRGRRYRDAEAAFWKHAKGLNFDEQRKLCTEIIAAKLTQYPELVEAIDRLGGVAWLQKCRHFTGARSEVFRRWEGEGKGSAFIRCLMDAYERVKRLS